MEGLKKKHGDWMEQRQGYDRCQASMRGVCEDTSCLRENRSERAVS